jgi:flagellar hook-length control protein FliK
VSNLTVSYVSQTPAGTPAGVTAAAEPAADSPLGFLAALVDQWLAGDAEAVTGDMAAKTGAEVTIPGLMSFALDGGMEPTGVTASTPQPTNLFAALGAQLDKLAASLNAGEAPSPAQLRDLRSAISALTEALDAAPAAPIGAADPVGSITSAADIGRTTKPAITSDQIVDLLSKLGLIEAPQAKPSDRPAAAAEVEAPDQPVALHDRLLALSQSLAATAPDLSQKLEALATRIEAKPEVALALTEPQPDADAVTIASIIRTLLGHGDAEAAPTEGKPKQADVAGAPAADDDLLKILATLGIRVPPTSGATPSADASVDLAASTTPAATTVPAPLVRLSNQLSTVAAELATASPELAKKLETVATQLVSANVDPELLGKLISLASQPNGTALDKLVQSLVEPTPATTVASVSVAPQISAPAELALPAPLAPKQSKSAVTEVKAALPEPAPVTADSAPKPAQNVTLAAAAQEPASDAKPEAKAEAKVSAIIADAARSDPATQPAQAQLQQAPAAAQQARVLPAAYQPVANPINMGQVAFEMVRQVHQGSSRFTIRLDPPELGRVDVKMQVDATGNVNARLTVDRAETLDLFQRDRQSLERALSQAGLDASKTNLEFSLRQQHHNPFSGMMGGDQHHQQSGHGAAAHFAAREADDTASLPAITLYRGTASAAGVNIFA